MVYFFTLLINNESSQLWYSLSNHIKEGEGFRQRKRKGKTQK